MPKNIFILTIFILLLAFVSYFNEEISGNSVNEKSIHHISKSLPLESPAPPTYQDLTPEELTNELLLLNKEYYSSKNQDQKSSLEKKLILLAKIRYKKMEEIMDSNILRFQLLLLSSAEISKLPFSVKNYLEKPINLKGKIESRHIDGPNPRYESFILEGKTKKRINTFEPLNIQSGMNVNLNAYSFNGKYFTNPNTINVNFGRLTPSKIDTIGEQKTAVLMFKYPDGPSDQLYTVSEAQDMIFNGTIQNFYKENSYGKMWFSGDVFEWYTMPYDCNGGLGGIDEEDAIQIADNDVFFPNYTRIIILEDNRPCNPNAFFAWGSIGKLNLLSNDGQFNASVAHIPHAFYFFNESQMPSGGQRPYYWVSGLGLLAHELGHNLGISHAKNWECGEDILYGMCDYRDYTNLFGVMSKSWVTGEQMYFGGELYENPSAAYHFGAKFKEYFKWNTGKNFLKIKDSGVYKLKPLEKTNSVVAKVYQKDYPDLLNYYLEYRVPFGYDESINDPLSAGNIGGLIINKVGLDGYGYPEIFVPATYQLDMSPTTNGLYDQDWYDVALLEGNVFEDKGTGIKIKHLGINSNLSDPELMFSVEFSSPQCIRNPPYWWRFDNQPITLSTKSTNWLSIPIRNSDSLFCSPSEFNVTFQFPKNWNYSSFEPLTIEPDNFKFGSITIDLLNDVIPGNYSTNVTFKNLDSGLEKDHPVIFKVLPP